jgi:hypothetical protein
MKVRINEWVPVAFLLGCLIGGLFVHYTTKPLIDALMERVLQ